jgi:hypothetical protein
MNKVRCHVTGRIEKSKRCIELRHYWGIDSCPKICGRLPYGYNQYFQKLNRDKRQENETER